MTVAECPKPTKTEFSGDDAADVRNNKRAERDDVVAQPPPQKQSEDDSEQCKQKHLVSGHVGCKIPHACVIS